MQLVRNRLHIIVVEVRNATHELLQLVTCIDLSVGFCTSEVFSYLSAT
jgi:hypothetical protein